MNLPDVLIWAGTARNGRSSTLRKYVPEIESGGLSIVGPVREDNQDSIHLPDHEHPAGPGLLFAIADGMGGYTRTTLTAAYVFGDILYLAHVGDSRAYLIRDGRATCLTADHTAVGDMVRAKILSPDKIRAHTQRSVLTKAIGIGLFVQADIIQYRLHEGDRLVLCSDGVWSVIEDDEFARVVREQIPVDLISRNLIDLALQHKTDDNASTVVFHLRKLVAAPENHGAHQENKWFKKLRKLVP